jgi:hypothetical protein
MSSQKRTTMAKLTRERKVQERRALKQEKRLARKANAENELTGEVAPGEETELAEESTPPAETVD